MAPKGVVRWFAGSLEGKVTEHGQFGQVVVPLFASELRAPTIGEGAYSRYLARPRRTQRGNRCEWLSSFSLLFHLSLSLEHIKMTGQHMTA